MRGCASGKILHGIEGQREQTGKEKHRESKQRIDQLLLGQQVHQETGNEEGIDAGHRENEGDFDRPSIMGGQIRNINHQGDGAEHPNENIDAALQITFVINRV